MNKIHPKLQAAINNMSDEQIAEILNTKYSASDVVEQKKGLEQLKEQLCNPKQVTIEGWIAVDEAYDGGAYLHAEKPHSELKEFCDTGGYETEWVSKGDIYRIDNKLFPDITPETEPKRYKITITPIEE